MAAASPATAVRNTAAADTDTPEPTDVQQKVLDRIALQRDRLRARRAARAQSVAMSAQHRNGGAGGIGGIDESLALRAVSFAREHPVALVALAGVGLVAGPRRLIRWAGVVLPLVMRLRR